MDEKKTKGEQSDSGAALTRREWLLRMSSALVLSGLPVGYGLSEQDLQAVSHTLPPGLFAPSLDHLSRALESEGPFLRVAADTETEFVRPRSGPFVPQAFAQKEFLIVRKMVQIILGEDLKDSSGNSVRGFDSSVHEEVAEWIDLVVASAPKTRTIAQNLSAEHRALAVAYFGSAEAVRELELFEPERLCREGFAWLDEESRRRFSKIFLDTDEPAQMELVQAISDARPDKSAVNAGTRLFDFFKAESIRGFYTSRAGLKELGKGNSFYGESPGCGLTSSG